jgi:hypothetical protein
MPTPLVHACHAIALAKSGNSRLVLNSSRERGNQSSELNSRIRIAVQILRES